MRPIVYCEGPIYTIHLFKEMIQLTNCAIIVIDPAPLEGCHYCHSFKIIVDYGKIMWPQLFIWSDDFVYWLTVMKLRTYSIDCWCYWSLGWLIGDVDTIPFNCWHCPLFMTLLWPFPLTSIPLFWWPKFPHLLPIPERVSITTGRRPYWPNRIVEIHPWLYWASDRGIPKILFQHLPIRWPLLTDQYYW